MGTVVCIAGKNKIAVESAIFIKKFFPNFELIGCVNENDSGQDGWQPSFKRWCVGNNVAIKKLEQLYCISNMVFFSLEYDKILDIKKFSTKKLFNIHFSRLPAYKGMYTAVMPILCGETVAGVTLHKIDSGIDTGDIVASSVFNIGEDWTARDMYFKFLDLGVELFNKNFNKVSLGDFSASPQPAKGSSYFSKHAIDFNNISIDLNKTAYEICQQIRAYTFKEYQLVSLFGRHVIGSEILCVRSDLIPGTVIKESSTTLDFSTIDYDMRIHFDCNVDLKQFMVSVWESLLFMCYLY